MKSYAMKPKRVGEISLRFQPPNTITSHLHSFKIITRFPFYSPSFSQLPRLIILFLLKKLVGTSILKIELKIMSREIKNPQWSEFAFLKRKKKEVKVDPKFSGQWKEKEKVPMLGGQWKEKEKVLLFGGQWKEKKKEKVLFHFFPIFPPKQLYLNLHFFSLKLWRLIWPHLINFKLHKWMKNRPKSHL